LTDNDLHEMQSAVESPGQRAGDVTCHRLSGSGTNLSGDEFRRIIDAWPNLSNEIRRAIYSLVIAIATK